MSLANVGLYRQCMNLLMRLAVWRYEGFLVHDRPERTARIRFAMGADRLYLVKDLQKARDGLAALVKEVGA